MSGRIVALWSIAVALCLLGIAAVVGETWWNFAPRGIDDRLGGDYLLAQLLGIVGPALVWVGLATAMGTLFLCAVRWERARS